MDSAGGDEINRKDGQNITIDKGITRVNGAVLSVDDGYCSFCYRPGPEHEGGVLTEYGPVSGWFCSKECFEKWEKFYPAFYVSVMRNHGATSIYVSPESEGKSSIDQTSIEKWS